MEVDDEVVFLLREVAALEVGAQVVDPPQPAALPAALQPRRHGKRPPAALAVSPDVGDEPLVLLLGPCALVRVRLLAARRPPHTGLMLLDRSRYRVIDMWRALLRERERELVRERDALRLYVAG